ncbi:hypothetical protein CAOG_07837 [Capsaspora owczarzaki ATCC 30864]|uniref:Uncharacterized protein n=1 Tax=Capsaspora owczarzaki (strain ATCC 30864) TaxID=595528 RepID=A0A0D2WY09_CAPO3|nr:hypothetical protein CAOG_07837 [Capsaspora owczarzaki ATCC 30864]KJE97733.1 hypothetical protein CAOG_007837 [Capsaspora owczarzaki ATCC 30864]|eukprot:XP_004342910.2 hypothetical protein CAOG_07837 [Capsaspora owczarzaki ATCC 30864]
MTIEFYELVAQDGRAFSPLCWPARLALAHKDIHPNVIACRFSEVDAKIAFTGQNVLPVLVDGADTVLDAWTIAEHLDTKYPNSGLGLLFPTSEAKETARRFNQHIQANNSCILHVIASDIARLQSDEDRAVFIQKRARHWNNLSVEEFTSQHRSNPASRPAINAFLQPFRDQLGSKKFMLGDAPTYADYLVASQFIWACTVSPYILIGEDDVLFQWRERVFDLFGDLVRNNPAYPLIPC